jgi:hypothetical protein
MHIPPAISSGSTMAGGTVPGGAGGTYVPAVHVVDAAVPGVGGSGGATGTASVPGGGGGNGWRGGGGGAGGGGFNGVGSGAGGRGGDGFVVITTYF